MFKCRRYLAKNNLRLFSYVFILISVWGFYLLSSIKNLKTDLIQHRPPGMSKWLSRVKYVLITFLKLKRENYFVFEEEDSDSLKIIRTHSPQTDQHCQSESCQRSLETSLTSKSSILFWNCHVKFDILKYFN